MDLLFELKVLAIIVSFITIVAGVYVTLLIKKMRFMRQDITEVEDDFTKYIEDLVQAKLNKMEEDNKNE